MNWMRRSNYTTRGQDGTTVVEILIVCVIIAVVAGFALMQRGSANEQFQRQNVARGLKVAFERARFDSVKRRAECNGDQAKVVLNGTSFILTSFENQGGAMVAVPRTTSLAGQNIVIADSAGATLSTENSVYFNQRGEAVDVSGVLISPSFLVCGGGACPDPLTNDRVNRIYVSPTGTVNMLGAQTPPSLGSPGGTAPVTDAINDNLVLSTGFTCP